MNRLFNVNDVAAEKHFALHMVGSTALANVTKTLADYIEEKASPCKIGLKCSDALLQLDGFKLTEDIFFHLPVDTKLGSMSTLSPVKVTLSKGTRVYFHNEKSTSHDIMMNGQENLNLPVSVQFSGADGSSDDELFCFETDQSLILLPASATYEVMGVYTGALSCNTRNQLSSDLNDYMRTGVLRTGSEVTVEMKEAVHKIKNKMLDFDISTSAVSVSETQSNIKDLPVDLQILVNNACSQSRSLYPALSGQLIAVHVNTDQVTKTLPREIIIGGIDYICANHSGSTIIYTENTKGAEKTGSENKHTDFLDHAGPAVGPGSFSMDLDGPSMSFASSGNIRTTTPAVLSGRRRRLVRSSRGSVKYTSRRSAKASSRLASATKRIFVRYKVKGIKGYVYKCNGKWYKTKKVARSSGSNGYIYRKVKKPTRNLVKWER